MTAQAADPVDTATAYLREHGYPEVDRAAVAHLWATHPIRSYLERKGGDWPWQALVREYVENPDKRKAPTP